MAFRLLACGLLLVCLGTLSVQPVRAVVDEAENFQELSSRSNIVQADIQGGQALVESAFDGDATRFARLQNGEGQLGYTVPQGIEKVIVSVFVDNTTTAGQWELTLSVGTTNVLTLSAQQLQSELSDPADPTTNQVGDGYEYQFSGSTPQWVKGTVTITPKHSGAEGCETSFNILINGGEPDSVQIGRVEIQEAQDPSVCGSSGGGCGVAPPPPKEGEARKTCPEPAPDTLRTFYDGATRTQQLFASANIKIATDEPASFSNDKARLARRDPSAPGSITYHFDEGGMFKVRASVALQLPTEEALTQVNITVKPYVSIDCKPEAHLTQLDQLVLHPMKNGWKFVEIEYTVGSLTALGCELAKFVEIAFYAPAGSDIQLMSLKLIGDGHISGLQELENPGENPNKRQGILENNLIVWILVGVGTLFVLILIGLVWCCCGRPCCGSSSDNAANPNGMKNGVELGKLANGSSRMQLQGQVVIPVDCVVPDMPVSMDGDSGQLHTMGQKFPSGAYANGQRGMDGRKGMQQPNGHGHPYAAAEPVVDLSVPMPAQPEYMGAAGFAPKQGQDIFDTWQQAGLSDYHSGEDYEASGPLDTRERSFTGNPPVSSTGNTSPTQESSVIGVTAQLGMRLKELKSLQGEHERLAKGQADSNGDFASAPEPLGVKYGRKIGVGGFGAVYEGEWAGKTVAIKVIKMPHSAKASEDKEKMAFMEYAISGILLHNNIVQTYQADIRPVFLDDDTETGTVSRSGWTGLGEFLSNDAISQKMHKSMRIQEWELRLVMEYCNKGNLKEAIRQKSLMTQGSVKALEVALLALDIAKACQAIHKHNIIHGDLKPHNVLLTQEVDDERGWIGKIADFGLSVKIKRGEQHVSGIQHGTEGYVAPEVLQTRRMVKASDVYSFGIIMWELWHARLYYEEYRHAQRRMRRVTLDFRPTFERGCPEEWINLAKSCWALRPEERPDFDRVVKMMRMIVASIREKVNEEGVITELY